jgi:hypothetical protein
MVIRMPRRGSRWYTGEFTGAAGSISGVKFKNEVSVTRTGAGLYTFQCLENGAAARPGTACRIAKFASTPVNLTTGAQGGWFFWPLVDSLTTNGSFTTQASSQAGAAADIQVLMKIAFLIELEAA